MCIWGEGEGDNPIQYILKILILTSVFNYENLAASYRLCSWIIQNYSKLQEFTGSGKHFKTIVLFEIVYKIPLVAKCTATAY